jgi:DTW domain-containing protein YfiP
MRNNIHEALVEWLKTLKGFDPVSTYAQIYQDDLKRLERELLIIITSPTAEERDQDVINRTIASLRGVLDAPNPPSARRMFEEQLNVSRMPYLEQKILQNLAAYIHRQAFNEGRQCQREVWDIVKPAADGDAGNSG